MGYFDNLVKAAGNEFATKAADGLDSDIAKFIDTGSYSLNALLSGSIYGGLSDNRVTALAGEESTGKTFYSVGIASSFLRDNTEGAVMYFESEGALSTEILRSRGVDTNRVFVFPVVTIEEFRTQAAKILDGYLATENRKPLMMILDSLGSTSTNKEITDISAGKDVRDMTRAQLIRGAFRALTLKLNRARVPLVITNHVGAVIGSYVPAMEMSGGMGLRYSASVVVYLRKAKHKDSEGQQDGVVITAKLDKSRLAREGEQVTTLLRFSGGLDRYYGLLDIAEKAGILKRVANKFQFPNGKSAFESTIYREPEKWFTEDVLKAIDTEAKKRFTYSPGEKVPDDPVVE